MIPLMGRSAKTAVSPPFMLNYGRAVPSCEGTRRVFTAMLNPKEVGRKTWPKNPDWVSLLNKKALHQSSHERVIINLL